MFTVSTRDGYSEIVPGVWIKTLTYGERTMLTEFRLRQGAVIPSHHHAEEQTGYLVSGALRFTVAGETTDAVPGDSWNLPADLPHGAVALQDSVVVEVFAPAREDYMAYAATKM